MRTPPRRRAYVNRINCHNSRANNKRQLKLSCDPTEPLSVFYSKALPGQAKPRSTRTQSSTSCKKKSKRLLLVPEIAIATHLVERLRDYFGEQALLWHSGISKKHREERWLRAINGEPLLLIGTRSALFVPLPKLAMITIDEEQDSAYKQWDQEPRFHARVVAQFLATQYRCPLVLGSATPSLETIFSAKQGLTTTLRLTERYGGSRLPTVELIDRRGTPTAESLSPASHKALADTLAQKRQAIVLINRRGAAPLVLCENCGHIWRCQQCERTLVWHQVPRQSLRCHFCDQTTAAPDSCPACQKKMVVARGHGSQRIEQMAQSLHSTARVARLDADISSSAKKIKELTRELNDGMIDVLVGTQLVAKGWDLEKVDLVIVLNADQGLLSPDFRAHERTVQLLWQVAGRAGRRNHQGRVLIETTQPDHPAFTAVASHTYERFVSQELAERKRFGYPPHKHVVMFYRSSGQLDEAETLRSQLWSLRQTLQDPDVHILPAQRTLKPRGKHAISISLLTTKPAAWIRQAPPDWSVDLDPESLL